MSFFTDLSQQYIDGEWRVGRGSWDVIDFNPYNGEKLAAVTAATGVEVDEAYQAAARAQPGWAAAGPHARRDVLERARTALVGLREETADAMIAELGATRAKAYYEIDLAAEFLRHAAGVAVMPDGELLPALAPGKENRVYREPAGVVTVISPFNYPLLVTLKSVAPALALGNAVLVKPNQNAPIVGGGLVARIFELAGLPAGVLNVLVTDIAEIGDDLIEHPVPKVISFSGSDRIGRHVAAVAARALKRTVLQLSGNGAFVALGDLTGAALDRAVDAAVFSRYVYQGQVCMAANRILVDRALEPGFSARFTERVAALRTGDPADPATQLGPVIDSFHAEALTALVDEALAEGATPLLRGRTVGNLVEPTILTGLSPHSPLLRQEIFGPVALLVPFDGDEEGLRLTNDTPYGLSSAVHTGDAERGVAFARRVEAGMIHVNGTTMEDDPMAAFGGVKRSGIGRLNGAASVDAFTTQRWISVQHGPATYEL
ncbi:aldehyde dehydrogenase family protein [Streptomyces sp. SPB074]|uniref:aldehyde dehydrogenase family protein n=1 Tax=Streptomyces sp. (strain SPB074) TaxID=465543 RepID=UPI0001D1DEC9|nr:aldehyde dehydrogenase family protein [Streptomyces sp. SPB074]EFG64871.1 benzaldehyde dehydrogenase [Streptomyces sp. SPB074]